MTSATAKQAAPAIISNWPLSALLIPSSAAGPIRIDTPAKPSATPVSLRQVNLSSEKKWARPRVNSGTVVIRIALRLVSMNCWPVFIMTNGRALPTSAIASKASHNLRSRGGRLPVSIATPMRKVPPRIVRHSARVAGSNPVSASLMNRKDEPQTVPSVSSMR